MKSKRSLLALAVLVIAVIACQSVSFQPQRPAPVSELVIPVAPIDSNATNPAVEQEGLVALYESVSPGTVAIITDQGQGSGFVYDAQGHVLTNYHVIEGTNSVEVRFPSGYMAYGTVIGTDLDSDLAIIKVDAPASELHPLPLGDSSALKVGQTVVAIGNPFGLNSTMTVGICFGAGAHIEFSALNHRWKLLHSR